LIVCDDPKVGVRGFGVRAMPSGQKSFILRYRSADRRTRVYTLGQYPTWSVVAARERAKKLRRAVDDGEDPAGDRRAEREADTVDDLCDRYKREHMPRKRPASQAEDSRMIEKIITRRLGKLKVVAVSFADIDRLHRKLSESAPYRANRTLALLSKLFNLAMKWRMRTDNPVRGVQRNVEQRRERFLSANELQRLSAALARHPNQRAANQIRLLLLTGARRGEVLTMRWADVDLGTGVWVKPSAHTKQNKEHRVPLSPAACSILAELRKEADDDAQLVFPTSAEKPAAALRRAWPAICKSAGLAERVELIDKSSGKPVKTASGAPVMVWKSTLRVHDLRHSHASILVGAGVSLAIIARVLGHTQVSTTARYAHVADDPAREAVGRVSSLWTAVSSGAPPADIKTLPRQR
jgi:integrase